MKRPLSLLLILFLLFNALLLPSHASAASEGLAQSLPLDEYPLGSYFTKNGKRCTCHNSGNCIASGSACNCMRFWPTGRASTCEIDLLGVQCIGFARYCQYRLFGFIDYGDTAYRFTNLLGGTLKAGNWSAADAEYYIKKAGTGGHIRISTHSIVIADISDTGFTTYECNGKTYGSECRVFARSFTWKSFYQTYGNTTWRYLNMPKEEYLPAAPVPETTQTPETTPTPVTTPVPETVQTPETTQAPQTTEETPVSDAPVTTDTPQTTGETIPPAELPSDEGGEPEEPSAPSEETPEEAPLFPLPAQSYRAGTPLLSAALLTDNWFAQRRLTPRKVTRLPLLPLLPHPYFRNRNR